MLMAQPTFGMALCVEVLGDHPGCPSDSFCSAQYAAAHGQDVSQMPLHTCQCPPCFEQKGSGNSATCAPKCSLDSCDLVTGVCAPGSGASGALTGSARGLLS